MSLLGRIQIIKTFAILKRLYRVSVITISKELIKEANSLFYSFIWNGKDKVTRHALISDFLWRIIKVLGKRFLTSCFRRLDASKLKIQFPAYYKEWFDTWSELNGKKASSSRGVVNENNKLMY